jgi:hypothetical protein
VVKIGMAKSPASRYACAADLVKDLDNAIHHRALTKQLQQELPEDIRPATVDEKKKWARGGRTLEEKTPEYILAAAAVVALSAGGLMLAKNIKTSLENREFNKQQRERMRVYRDLGELLADRFEVDLLEGVLLAMELLDQTRLDLAALVEPGSTPPERKISVEQARQVLLSARVTYRGTSPGSLAEIDTEIYFLKKDGRPARRVATSEVKWHTLPDDIREHLLRDDQDYSLIIYSINSGGTNGR